MAGGFFNNAPVIPLKHKPALFIRQGSDSPFTAAAVALLDVFKSKKIPDTVAKPFLSQLLQNFPKYKVDQPFLTADERIKSILNLHRMGELVQATAFSLTQLAIDEMLKHPLRYQEVWQQFDTNTAIDQVRRSELPPESLRALSGLGIDINLLYLNAQRTLPDTVCWQGTSALKHRLSITLQIQDKTCFPRVTHATDFSYVGHLPVKLTPEIQQSNETIAQVMADINAQRMAWNKERLQHEKVMHTMMDAGELDKNALLDLYVTFYPVERDAGMPADTVQKLPIEPQKTDATNNLCSLMVRQLSTWLASQRIDQHAFYAALEALETTPISSQRKTQ